MNVKPALDRIAEWIERGGNLDAPLTIHNMDTLLRLMGEAEPEKETKPPRDWKKEVEIKIVDKDGDSIRLAAFFPLGLVVLQTLNARNRDMVEVELLPADCGRLADALKIAAQRADKVKEKR